MQDFHWFQSHFRSTGLFFAAVCLGGSVPHAAAAPITLSVSGMVTSSTINGAALGAGVYTIPQLALAGSAIGQVTANGLTGISLWSLLGGTPAGLSDVTTSTPNGDNGKNAILRSYVLATDINGAQSVVSLGEIDPFFGGTGIIPNFVAFSGTDGQPELVFPGANASGRNVVDLASLQILAAPAVPLGPGGFSTSLTLTGNTSQPGAYNLTSLQALPSASTVIGNDTYTGVTFWNLISPTDKNSLNQFVLTTGTDGYEVLFSSAELNPALGAPQSLVAYADTQGQFPAAGLSRIVVPGDSHAGRYVSNLNSIAVLSTPEPGTAGLLLLPLLAVLFKKARQGIVG